MILPDRDIQYMVKENEIDIEPYNESQVEPASYDIQLDDSVMFFDEEGDGEVIVNPDSDGKNYDTLEKDISDGIHIQPGTFFLASTKERIELPDFIGATVMGRSSFGRLGLEIHRAGWIDPGFCGTVTLELDNASPNTIYLEEGMRIGQLVFQYLREPSTSPYTGDYNGQDGVTDSKFNSK